ncbi:MAG TPA: DUF6599 family protein [Candidatus Acidoferrales bacterium]|nr:DUF6599 family protein [Candidatus Acidoferrales bacterium]
MIVRQTKLLALALLLGLVCTLPCFAADAQPQPVLPLRFGNWTLGAAQEVSGAGLSDALGDKFAILVESGLIGAQRGTFTRTGAAGPASMGATLYRFRDSNGAYAAYTFLRTADLSSSDLTEKSAVGRERILAVIGGLLLDLSGPGAASLADLKTLVTLIQQETPRGIYPTLWQYLPGQGFERTSDHYLLGPAALDRVFPLEKSDWLGFGQGAEAESARYHTGNETLTLLLAVYPTPQIARLKLEELEKRFNMKPPALPVDQDASRLGAALPDGPAGVSTLYAERRGLMVTCVAGAHDARTARAIFDRVEYQTAVTWNAPSWEAKEPPFLVMIVNILIGTCLLLLYAFVAGLLFAGVRLLIKRLAPGRVFDRDESVELLQLGLGSKPIQVKDFLSLRPPD